MNILTDEELESIKFDQRDQLVDFETLRAVEAAVLAKLAALDMKPAAYITYKGHLLHADDPKVLEHSNPEPLYTQDQLIAAQQRTAEACAKVCGYMILPSKPLSDHPYQAWLAGTLQCAEAINSEEWRKYL